MEFDPYYTQFESYACHFDLLFRVLKAYTFIRIIGTWADLSNLFLTKYFPRKKTAKVRAHITSFSQRSDESIYEAWDRFHDLMLSCPHHNVPDWMLVESFMKGLSKQNRFIVNNAAGGSIIQIEPRGAIDLFKKIAHQHQWSYNYETRETRGGKYEVDEITALKAKVDAQQA